jgi:ABC-type multidrug transport system permease subunit
MAGAGDCLPVISTLLAGIGLLISAFSRTQTQAIQFSVFFLLPVFVLSGAFAPLQQLPQRSDISPSFSRSRISAVRFDS